MFLNLVKAKLLFSISGFYVYALASWEMPKGEQNALSIGILNSFIKHFSKYLKFITVEI